MCNFYYNFQMIFEIQDLNYYNYNNQKHSKNKTNEKFQRKLVLNIIFFYKTLIFISIEYQFP